MKSDWTEWNEYMQYQYATQAVDPKSWYRAFLRENRYKAKNYVLRLLNAYGDAIMARGKKLQPAQTNRATNAWTEFVDVPMSGVEMQDVVDAYRVDDTMYDAVVNLLQTGHRLSFSYNPSNDAIIVTVTCKNVDSPNNGKTFTSFAGDWHTGLMVALYKFENILPENWAELSAKSNKPLFG